MTDLRVIIGLEIHVQLKTRTKLFCRDEVAFDAPPNTRVCPVCLGLPGALPVPNRHAVELGVRAATALDFRIARTSRFTRKNYFYPDLPKGYQITQYEEPLATGGRLELRSEPPVRLRRAHLEEDAGKLLHERFAGKTAIDMNRAGVPLLEIVTEPDITSPRHAHVFLTALKRVLQYSGISDCEMEKGSLRVDANVSLVRGSDDPAGAVRTELKNLNSFGGLERALHAEITRQQREAAASRPLVAQTLSWNDATGQLRVLRDKEGLAEYRYVPEPDLPALVIPDELFLAVELPELPQPRAARFCREYGLREVDADILTGRRALADFFEELTSLTGDAHLAATWTLREVLATANAAQTEFAVTPAGLAELIDLVRREQLSSAAARVVFRRMCETSRTAAEIAQSEQWLHVVATNEVDAWVSEVLAAHSRELDRYRAGELRILEFFVGEIMRKGGGRVDPRLARASLESAIQRG